MIAAVMLVKDESDMVGWTLLHLLEQGVDRIYVADNGSTDGTAELLASFAAGWPGQVTVGHDPDPGYWQSEKTTALAVKAWQDGSRWVIPCDADEIWTASDGRPVADVLRGLPPDVLLVHAEIRNHVPTSADDHADASPLRRMPMRLAEVAPLGKVACRAAGDLTIEQGNHGARYDDAPHTMTVRGLLAVHHYSWRSADQYLRKIRNGEAAYAATDLPDEVGAHWRMFAGASDDAIRDHFRRWFHDPDADLIHDPPGCGCSR